MLPVQLLQVHVALVLRVAGAVIRQRHGFVGRFIGAQVTVVAAAVFIDVVAKMDHEVEVGAFGDAPVSVEVAMREAGAADHGQAQAAGVADRQGLGATYRRLGVGGTEAVVVSGVGPQAVGVDLDGVVAAGVGADAAALDYRRHLRITCHDKVDHDSPAAGWRDAGPQEDCVGQGVAARHAMQKAGGARRRHRVGCAPATAAACLQHGHGCNGQHGGAAAP